MPKIFLIKNRLRQQQLLLNQEQQNGTNNKNDLGHGDSQPLSLIVHKKEEGKTPDCKQNPGDFNTASGH